MTPLAEIRRELGLSLEEMAKLAGLRSRGHLSQIERGEAPASVSVALNLEALSERPGLASLICPDIQLVRSHDTSDLAQLKASLVANLLAETRGHGAENTDTNISRTSATALGDASMAERVADPDPTDGAVGGNAVVGSVTSPADRASTHRDIHQRLPGFASAGGVQLNGSEVGEANLDPARTSDTGDRLDAETVTVADIADGPGEGLTRPGLGGHGAAIRNPDAGVGQGGRGDQEAKGETESDHAATVAQVGVAA